MNCMLQTVGFSDIEGVEAERRLRNELIYGNTKKTTKTAKLSDNRTAVEIFCEIAPNTGMVYRGENDRSGVFLSDCFFPAHISKTLSLKEPIIVSKRMDSNAFTAMAYEYTHKIPIIFYLQNEIEMYLKYDKDDKDRDYEVYLSGIAGDGKIILPIEGPKVEVGKLDKEKKAGGTKESDEEELNEEELQMRFLAEKEISDYLKMNGRIKNEDLYSIIETTFMPCGTEVDTYTIIGKINSVENLENNRTAEEMFLLGIECNGVVMEICINKKNLLGVPEVGRRFKGNVWLQGYVNWSTEKENEEAYKL